MPTAPRTDPYVQSYRIRLLPKGRDGKKRSSVSTPVGNSPNRRSKIPQPPVSGVYPHRLDPEEVRRGATGERRARTGTDETVGTELLAISEVTGDDRKTVRKYLLEPEAVPIYGRRAAQPSKLDPHEAFLQERLRTGVWNAQMLLREVRQRGYTGGYTILKDWLHPQRAAASSAAVRRFETPAGKQAQADWGPLGYLDTDGRSHQIWGFTITLGYSRRLWVRAALDQNLGTLLRLHEAAFQEWGAVPEEILDDRMRTVWLGTDDRGEILWHPVFLDFARYRGFKPRLCRPYRAQTKGKIESGVKYVRQNFVCGLLGREPSCLMDFNSELRQWVDTVANRRVCGSA